MISERQGLFSAFRYPQYCLLWVSSLTTHTGRWMETVVVTWLVLELTNSPFLVGLVGACRTAGMLLGPFSGTIADRFDRRRVLMVAQLIPTVGAFIIMVLFLTERLEVWYLFVFVLVEGISFSLDFAARFPLAADIVKRRHLANATSLLFVTMGITSGIGPMLGGGLLGLIQASGCFAVITACFFISLMTLAFMKLASSERPVSQQSAWENFIGGLRYVRNDKPILSLILIAAAVNFFVPPIILTLVPIFARDILYVGANGLGQLMGAMGLGGLVGSLVAGTLGNFGGKGKLIIIAAIGGPAIMMFLAVSRLFPIALMLLFLGGVGQWMVWALMQTLLLQWSSEEMRGRVSGVRAFAISTLPPGNLLTGALTGLWGAPTVLLIDASASIAIMIAIAIWAPELRRRK